MRAAGRHVGIQEYRLCLCLPPVPEECECILPSCDSADNTATMDLNPAMWTGGEGKEMIKIWHPTQ